MLVYQLAVMFFTDIMWAMAAHSSAIDDKIILLSCIVQASSGGYPMNMNRTVLLLLALILTGCRLPIGGNPSGSAINVPARLDDSWQLRVEGNIVFVHREIALDSTLADFLRGSPALEVTALEYQLMSSGASDVQCRVKDTRISLVLICQYQMPLIPHDIHMSVAQIALPDNSFFAFLTNVPVVAAQGIHITTRGDVRVTGPLASLPATQIQQYGNDDYLIHRYEVASLSRLAVVGEQRFSPGTPVSVENEPAVVTFLPRYFPRSSAWLASGLALLMALLAARVIFPVNARLPLTPQLWTLDLSDLPAFARWPLQLIVRLVNGIRQNWPRFLNALLGTGLLLLGIQLLMFTWSLARLFDTKEEMLVQLHDLFGELPLAGLVDTLLWPGWIFVLSFLAATSLALGIGLLARRETARILVVGAGIFASAGHIFAWPHLLLAPPFVYLQLELLLTGGGALLFCLALLTRGLTHPQFRRYYLGEGQTS
jgi:hypothetical protein